MWNAPQAEPVENLENYKSEIKRAKAEISELTTDITSARKQKEEIISGNNELLKEKLLEVENIKQQLQLKLSEAHEQNIAITALHNSAQDSHKQLSENIEDLQLSKASHIENVSNKGKELLDREELLNKEKAELNQRGIDLEAKSKDNQDFLNKAMAEHVEANLVLEAALKKEALADQHMITINEMLQEAKQSNAEALSIKEQADNKLQESQIALEESRKNKKESVDNLAALLLEKQSFSDLIIESKKEKMEAVNLTQAAQKNVVEANLKIAELKELKEAMAKQEKSNVT